MQETQNLYFEQFIPDQTPQAVWDTIINSKEFSSLFTEDVKQFYPDMSGNLNWRRFLFFKVPGKYAVESYKENMHLLMSINAPEFSSVFLLTTEEQDGGVMLRIDHRSFYGANKSHYRFLFSNRWKKLTSSLAPKKTS